MFTSWRLAIAILFATVFLWGCAPGASPDAAPTGAVMDIAPTLSEYRMGVADKVRVTVFGEEALSGDFQVGANGSIALPLIGEVRASGLTTSEIQLTIARELAAGYINDPRVSVEITSYRPYYILGEVKKPGEYPYTNSLTVMNAVATAEGYTYRADTRRVFIKRADSSSELVLPLTTATRVLPGDTVRIGERFF